MDRHLDLAKGLKKLWNTKVTIIPNVIGTLGIVTKELIVTRGLRNKRKNGDHSHCYIIEIGQNTEKSTEDLRRLAVIQTPVKDHQLTLQ